MLDLAAGGLRGAKLEAVVDVAVHERLDFGDLERLLRSRQPGTAALREVLRPVRGGIRWMCGAGWSACASSCAIRAGLPRPSMNVVVAGRVRDFFWADVPLVAEADSFRWHRSPARLSEDRERDVVADARGHPVRALLLRAGRRPARLRRRYAPGTHSGTT